MGQLKRPEPLPFWKGVAYTLIIFGGCGLLGLGFAMLVGAH